MPLAGWILLAEALWTIPPQLRPDKKGGKHTCNHENRFQGLSSHCVVYGILCPLAGLTTIRLLFGVWSAVGMPMGGCV